MHLYDIRVIGFSFSSLLFLLPGSAANVVVIPISSMNIIIKYFIFILCGARRAFSFSLMRFQTLIEILLE